MTPDDIGYIARFTLTLGALVCSVVGLVQQRREHKRINALFAACSPLPGCACDDCRSARDRAADPPTAPEHVGTYRTNPRPQPTLPRKTPWWCYIGWHLWQYDRPAIRVGGLISYRYACQRAGCCAVEERW